MKSLIYSFSGRNIAFFLLLFVAISCSEDADISDDALIGTWILKTESGSHESLAFSINGTYEIVDYAYFLGYSGNSVFEKAKLTGQYQFDGQSISFLTAEVEFYDGAETDVTLLTTSGSTIGSFYGYDQVGVFADTNYVVRSIISQEYEPVSWLVVELGNEALKVKKGGNIFEYEKQPQ